jgi:hypothetical protein
MNNLKKLNIKQILITQPILDAAFNLNPIIDTYYLSINQNLANNEFQLNRMDNMMNANLDELLLKEPVVVKALKNDNGKQFGKKINGKIKPLYEIIDGRHRVCRIILERMTELECIIL